MKKVEQAALTRAALLKTARKLFTEYGYAGAATEEIVQQAGVTRGALYYHFRDKAGLFHAVLEEINVEIIQRIENALQSRLRTHNQKITVAARQMALKNVCAQRS